MGTPIHPLIGAGTRGARATSSPRPMTAAGLPRRRVLLGDQGGSGDPDRSATIDGSGCGGADRGAVTVEAALALSVLVLVLAGALAAVSCLVGHLRCVDAAREAARLAARGDDAGAAAAVERSAPTGSRLTLDRGSEVVTATVSSAAAGGLLPGVTLSATAIAAAEPTSGGIGR